jgi:CheY-like chemotaxis protein
MLITGAINHYSYPILDNGISSFYNSYSNNGDRLHDHHQQHLTQSSYSLTDPNYLQSQGSNLHTIVETETKVSLKPPFIKRILVVDDDPDITLTFKAGLDGHYYGDGDKKKRFEVYTYNDPLLVLKEFKPHFYDLLLTDIYMPNINGFQLCEKILELDVNIRLCFMSALAVNIQALSEVYRNVNLGCFIEKPVSIDYLINRLAAELD